MSREGGKFNNVIVIFISAVAVIAVVLSLVFLFLPPEVSKERGYVFDYSVGWKNSNGITMSINGIINTGTGASADSPLVITKGLADIKNGDMIYIHSRNLIIDLYANGEPLYLTSENGSNSVATGFDNYIFVSLPYKTGSDRLEMRVYPTVYSDNCGIGSIFVGQERDVIRKLFADNAFPVVSSVIFTVLGIGLIIFGIYTRKKIEDYLSSVYFGMFLVLLSLGAIFNTSWAHIISDNVIFSENSQRIFLSAALPAFLAFVDAFFVTEHVYPVKIMCVISALIFPVLMVLNILGIISLISLATYYLIFSSVCGIVVFEELLVFMLKTRGTKALRKPKDYYSVFVFIACTIADSIAFVSASVGNDDLFFTRFGLYIVSAITLSSWFGEIITMIKLGVQAGRIGKIAFTDANTGIGNVAAFKSEFDELEAKKFGHRYIGIVQFDVNNLKVINDSKGHEAGDLLIKTAADIINKSFGAVGNCYRTGGDEFVALVTNDHAPITCEEAIYNFNKLIDNFNNDPKKPFDLRIAYGIAYYQNDKTANTSLKEIHKIADERMYENKKMLKARYARTAEEAVIR